MSVLNELYIDDDCTSYIPKEMLKITIPKGSFFPMIPHVTLQKLYLLKDM